ncbi:MAG: carboxypeptidase regulatory-like domain-containing protein [Clostridia bacterium]|nr:carboxypeptidase regulatory-like domain-containing protein [Clostridia bacterium]
MRNTRMLVLLFLFLLILPACALADGGQISGFVWNDASKNQTYDKKDDMLRDAAVSLYNVIGEEETLVDKITTTNNGAFSFDNLPAGNYRIKVTLPKNYQFITPSEGNSIMLPACGQSSVSPVFALAENQVMDTVRIGASKSSGYIKAYVFHDENENGGRRTTEEIIRGVPSALLYEHNGEWIVIAEATSDKDGCITYWDLTPGTYRLSATLPEGYIIGPLGEKLNAWYNNIVPADSNYGLSEPFEVPRGGSTGVGIGAIKTGSIEGTVWYDANMNGLHDSNETGYANATVSLVNEQAGVSRTLQSDAQGNYRFDLLAAGEYTLSVTLSGDVMFTLRGDSLFTDGYTLTQSTVVTVEKEKITAVQSVGVMPVTSLSVALYNDLNANGIREENEPPFAGAQLNVLVNGAALLSAQSDGEGMVTIPVLRGGDMTLVLSLPEGQVFTVPGEHNDFSALSAQNTIELPIALPHGESTLLHAGVTLPASVSGTLFDDKNVSGLPENGEGGLSGFTVQAVTAQGEIAAQTVTDENGAYRFDNLLPAPHTIRFCLTDAYVFSDAPEVDAVNRNQVITQTALHGDTDIISLAPGQQVESVCGGAFRSATVSGSVLLSAGNAAEILTGGMENVLIELLDADGFPVSDTTVTVTKADGTFYLKGALPGTYCLQYTLPEGCIFTEPLLDSSVYATEFFTLDTATDLTLPALSAVPAGSLYGVMYYDGDVNGAYDPAAETTFTGITVTLVNTDYAMTYETRTMDDGSFAFYQLRPGAYTISVALDEGFCFAYDESSLIPADIHSSVTAEFTLLAGQQYENSNIAISSPAGVSGQLYFDRENNNRLDENDFGAAGVTVVLQSADALHSYTAITDENGRFSLSPIVSGNYHLLVSLTSDCIPADSNPAQLLDGFYLSSVRAEDGEQVDLQYAILRYAMISGRVSSVDGTLKGAAGRTVTLYDASGTQLQQTVTDENGVYSFSSLKPAIYTVSCDLPDNTYEFARAGSDSVITHGDEPVCAPITVPMGENVSCPIGIGTPGAIGDIAWLDSNRNGLLDAGEKGVPEIKIELYLYGEKVAETATDGYGHYQFKDVFPGAYTMKVTMPKELRATVQREDYPLLSSILPESGDAIVEFDGVIIPSGGRNLNCDLGFVLVEEDVYPGCMMNLPSINWDYEK